MEFGYIVCVSNPKRYKVCQGNSKDALYVPKHYTTAFCGLQMYLCSYDDQNQANAVSKLGTADCLAV